MLNGKHYKLHSFFVQTKPDWQEKLIKFHVWSTVKSSLNYLTAVHTGL